MNYTEARRQARKLLGDHAECKEMKHVPVYRYVIGYMKAGVFHPLSAGMSWVESLDDLKKRIQGAKS